MGIPNNPFTSTPVPESAPEQAQETAPAMATAAPTPPPVPPLEVDPDIQQPTSDFSQGVNVQTGGNSMFQQPNPGQPQADMGMGQPANPFAGAAGPVPGGFQQGGPMPGAQGGFQAPAPAGGGFQAPAPGGFVPAPGGFDGQPAAGGFNPAPQAGGFAPAQAPMGGGFVPNQPNGFGGQPQQPQQPQMGGGFAPAQAPMGGGFGGAPQAPAQGGFNAPQNGHGNGQPKYIIVDMFWMLSKKANYSEALIPNEIPLLTIGYNASFANMRLTFYNADYNTLLSSSNIIIQNAQRLTTANIPSEGAAELLANKGNGQQIQIIERLIKPSQEWTPNQTSFIWAEDRAMIQTRDQSGNTYMFTFMGSHLFMLEQALMYMINGRAWDMTLHSLMK